MNEDPIQDLACPGCGEVLTLDASAGRIYVMREPDRPLDPYNPAGRTTITHGLAAVHQCADGEYLPPDQEAPPRR